MNKVVSWAALVELIAPYYPEGKKGHPPFSLETMLRTQFMQLVTLFALSNLWMVRGKLMEVRG